MGNPIKHGSPTDILGLGLVAEEPPMTQPPSFTRFLRKIVFHWSDYAGPPHPDARHPRHGAGIFVFDLPEEKGT